MYDPTTSRGTHNATSSPESVDGVSRCDLRDGLMTDLFGPVPAPASRSASRAKARASTTSATSGPSSPASSASADLQLYLENKSRALLDSRGSTLFNLTWKTSVTPAGRPICRLAASAPRTAGSASTGWPTPCTQDGPKGGPAQGKDRLPGVVALAAWPTPMAGTPAQNGNNAAGNNDSSRRTVELVAWPTPTAQDHFSANATANRSNPDSKHHTGTTLTDAARFAGWTTPSARDWKDSAGMATTGTNPDGSERSRLDQLPRQARLVGWATPQAGDAKNRYSNSEMAARRLASGKQESIEMQAHGVILNGSPAPTERRGQLNPAFSRWLQGYPKAWCEAAIEAWHEMPTKARKRG